MDQKRQSMWWPRLAILILFAIVLNPSDSRHITFMQNQSMESVKEARRKDPSLKQWMTTASVKQFDGESQYVNCWVFSYTENYDTGDLSSFGMFGFVW